MGFPSEVSPDSRDGQHSQKMDGPEKMVSIRKLFSFADSLDLVLMFIGTLGSIGAGAATPLQNVVFSQLIDALGKDEDKSAFKRAVALVALRFVYLGCGTAVASFLGTAAWMISGERQAARIRALYLKAILRQDLTFFDKEINSGNVISRMSKDTLSIQQAISGKILEYSSTFLTGFAIAYARSWKISLLLTATLPLVAVVGWQVAVRISKLAVTGEVAYTDAAKVVEQVLGAVRTVASYTGEKKAVENYDRALERAEKSDVRAGYVRGVGMGLTLCGSLGTIALAMWYASTLVAQRTLRPGAVINALFSIIIGGTALGMLSPYVTALSAGRAAAFQMFEVIHRKPVIDSKDMRGLVFEINGTIELRNVDFSYPTRPDFPVFRNFSLVVQSGTTAALVGESGSGKSSVVNLIERFYDPQGGAVLIDGVDIRTMQLRWLRQQIALVSQEPVLFETSIRENIAYGKDGVASLEEVRAAAAIANAALFIDRLPEGYETQVGARGIQLSGGQKQRVAIARAIMKNARILLLDEATSALDTESEHVVQAALDKVMVDCTTVVIAHRLSTIKNADLIAVVKEGSILETGTHSELSQRPESAYNQLIRLQETHRADAEKNIGRDNLGSLRSSKRFEDDDDSRKMGSVGSSRMLGSRRLSRTLSFLSEVFSNVSRTSSMRHDDSLVHDAEELGVLEDVEQGMEKNLSPAACDNEYRRGRRAKRVSLFRLMSMNKPELSFFAIGSLGAAVGGAVLPFLGLFLARIIGDLFNPNPHEIRKKGEFWALMFLMLAVVQLIVSPIDSICFAMAGSKLIRRVRTRTFDKVVRQEISWFDDERNSSGAVSSRLYADAAALTGLVGTSIDIIVKCLSTVTVGLVLALTSGWQLALVVLGLIPLLSMQGVAVLHKGESLSSKSKEKYAKASGIAYDAVSNIRTVASFSSEVKVADLYMETCKEPVRSGFKLAVVSGIGQGFSVFTLFAGYALGFWAGSRFVLLGLMTYEDVFKVFLSIALSAVSVAQTLSLAPDVAKAKSSANSVFEILDRDSKIDPASETGIVLSPMKGRIEFKDVTFKYPTRPNLPILQSLCFTLKAGKTLALVGESGSGKSTIISLLERFYDVGSGSILIDGTDIRTLQLKWLRQQIGLVSQEPVLFDETIRYNILYGREGITTEEELHGAARSANAHNFITTLPDGYDTRVGERGVQLSGGQKQRVAIARAIVKNPTILLLDEATSALDLESEHVVQEALDRVMQKRSALVVAHRLSTVRNCDQVAVMKNGIIVEQGKYDELLRKTGGVFNSLHQLHSLRAS